MVKWLRVLSPKDQSLDRTTHIRQLTTVNSSSKGSDCLLASTGHPQSQTEANTHPLKQNRWNPIRKIKLENLKEITTS